MQFMQWESILQYKVINLTQLHNHRNYQELLAKETLTFEEITALLNEPKKIEA